MTNYSSNLTAWGDSGSEYPSGYSYVEGEQPVDAWDNFFNSNVYSDLDHLINVTNERLDSTRSSAQPSSPTPGEQWYDPDNGELNYYDDVNGTWGTIATQDWVLNDASLGDADTVDGYDASEFAVRAENETITGDWTFEGSNTFNKALDIYADYSHIDLYESDNSNKNWRFEVNAGEFRVTEVGVDEQFAIDPGGLVNMPGGASVGDNVDISGNLTITSDETHLQLYDSGSNARFLIEAKNEDYRIWDSGSSTYRFGIKSDGRFNLHKGQLMNAVLERRSGRPGSPAVGQIIYRNDKD